MKYKIYIKEGKITLMRWRGLIYELPTKKIWRVRGRPSKDWICVGMTSSLEEAIEKAWEYISQ